MDGSDLFDSHEESQRFEKKKNTSITMKQYTEQIQKCLFTFLKLVSLTPDQVKTTFSLIEVQPLGMSFMEKQDRLKTNIKRVRDVIRSSNEPNYQSMRENAINEWQNESQSLDENNFPTIANVRLKIQELIDKSQQIMENKDLQYVFDYLNVAKDGHEYEYDVGLKHLTTILKDFSRSIPFVQNLTIDYQTRFRYNDIYVGNYMDHLVGQFNQIIQNIENVVMCGLNNSKNTPTITFEKVKDICFLSAQLKERYDDEKQILDAFHCFIKKLTIMHHHHHPSNAIKESFDKHKHTDQIAEYVECGRFMYKLLDHILRQNMKNMKKHEIMK